jgi:agmatinase
MQPTAGMPFTGIATFARAPYVTDLTQLSADFAVYGLPFDAAVGFRPGQRLAPRSIRDLSTRFAMPWGAENPGCWSIEEERWYLKGARLADVGDADPLYTDLEHFDRSVADLVGSILDRGAIPVGLGGDHSVSFPALMGFAGRGEVEILQLDAHLDFTDRIAGFPRSNSSPFRRASELDFVGGITVLGARGLRTNPEAHQAALARGNRIVTQRAIREGGLATALAAVPQSKRLYISIDIDALDPSIAPGTSSPEWEGMSLTELRAILKRACEQNEVVGLDLVEVNPYLDPNGMTSLLGARILVESMAWIHDRRA